MKNSAFAEGVLVKYKSMTGTIRFVCDQYVTVCVSTYDHKSRDVCVLVYRDEWETLKLLKESDK
jgi:hypothetical protein